MSYYVKCKTTDGHDLWVVQIENHIALHKDINEATVYMGDEKLVFKNVELLTEGLKPYADVLKLRLPFMAVNAERMTGIWPKALQGLVS